MCTQDCRVGILRWDCEAGFWVRVAGLGFWIKFAVGVRGGSGIPRILRASSILGIWMPGGKGIGWDRCHLDHCLGMQRWRVSCSHRCSSSLCCSSQHEACGPQFPYL